MHEKKSIFRRAMEISLLLHLLLVFIILPKVTDLMPSPGANPLFAVPEPPEDQRPPLDFEFVDLAEEREEAPVNDRVPLSDLDRRAHGGEGQAAARPSSTGNTQQLVQAQGGDVFNAGAPPQMPGPETRPVPTPVPEEEEPEEEPPRDRTEYSPEGAGDEAEPESQQPTLRLPPPGQWTLPPDEGGLTENPDRDGGQVDAGALSFDTQWYDWGPYAKAMLAKIRRHWRIPEIARLGVTGIVKVRYFIERDGTVTGLSIMDESGKPPMDFAARDAIAHSSPFEPLPSDLTGVAREGVTITFYYNLRAPTRGGR